MTSERKETSHLRALLSNLDVAPQAPFRFHSSTSISAFYESPNSIGQGSMGMKVNDMEWTWNLKRLHNLKAKARGWWNSCFPCSWLVQRKGEMNRSQEIEALGFTNPLSLPTNWGSQFSCFQRNGINQFIRGGFCAKTERLDAPQAHRNKGWAHRKALR